MRCLFINTKALGTLEGNQSKHNRHTFAMWPNCPGVAAEFLCNQSILLDMIVWGNSDTVPPILPTWSSWGSKVKETAESGPRLQGRWPCSKQFSSQEWEILQSHWNSLACVCGTSLMLSTISLTRCDNQQLIRQWDALSAQWGCQYMLPVQPHHRCARKWQHITSQSVAQHSPDKLCVICMSNKCRWSTDNLYPVLNSNLLLIH